MAPTPHPPPLGVVIVTYASGDVVRDCLESLLAATGVRLAVVVVDNGSPDETATILRDWAAGRSRWQAPPEVPFALRPSEKPLLLHDEAETPLAPNGHRVTLIEAGRNGGFAAGVNLGLAHLATSPELQRFWVLNPDCVVHPHTPAAFATAPAPDGGFALMGGRVIYLDSACDIIQVDGGRIDRRSGVTRNHNMFAAHSAAPPPDPAALDFITGASMVASRAFLERAGPMREDYFLYYEEVDWALRRGDLPLAYCPEAIVYHRAGSSIGSGRPGRPATPFSLYFLHRNRVRFVRRHLPKSLPGAYAYSVAKAGQLVAKGDWRGARALLAGSLGLPPPEEVRRRLSDEAARLAFAPGDPGP